ncbi:siderophore-interacting protein [Nonomuraea sp. NPDC050404]|uniref:siderophore-interacting protein n=1 Tax=Nonomuraea sp. NPDC050404 TaxID=3155783 RepID=UPI003402864E
MSAEAPKSAVVYARVLANSRITPNMARITLGGPEVAAVGCGGFDQRIKLLFGRPGQLVPRLPAAANWYQSWLDTPEEERAVMRTYTIRAHRPGEIDVDFVLHGDHGPASAWALRAAEGDVIGIIGSGVGQAGAAAIEYRPGGARRQLIAGDETALPAISAILEALPGDVRVRAFVEVPTEADIQELDLRCQADITWLPRSGAGPSLLEAVRAVEIEGEDWYAWVAGETGAVRDLRRHLRERGCDGDRGYFGGYWRHDGQGG